MNRRAFLKFLGIGVPTAAVAVVAVPALVSSVPEKVTKARLGEWNNYYSEGDPELMEAIEHFNKSGWAPSGPDSIYYDREMVQRLKFENKELFLKLASRNDLHIGSPISREFFQYNVKS